MRAAISELTIIRITSEDNDIRGVAVTTSRTRFPISVKQVSSDLPCTHGIFIGIRVTSLPPCPPSSTYVPPANIRSTLCSPVVARDPLMGPSSAELDETVQRDFTLFVPHISHTLTLALQLGLPLV